MKNFTAEAQRSLRAAHHLSIIILFLFIISSFVMAQDQQVSVQYSLGMSKPSTHFFEIELTYSNLPSSLSSLDVLLPVWRPGRYMVLDFAGGVQDFSVESGNGHSLKWSKVEKSRWKVETEGKPSITIRYKVYANEFNLRTRGLNDDHAFIDGASVFMYVEQFRNLPLQLLIHPYGDWHVTTGLDGDGKNFSVPNYDYLVDCPIEIGRQKDFDFSVEGVPHVLSIFGQGNWDADTLMRDISKIVSVEKNLWGEFPYKKYTFLLHCTPSSGGGTEHINSTIMGFRPFGFKNHDSYAGFLGLVAHEFFHTWNVKQLRPKGIHPYDYMKENYSRELWVAEGTTSYYGELLLVPAGFRKPEKYLEVVADDIQADRTRPGNAIQPVSESSFDAWVKYWRGTEQSYNTESDYYAKGADVSMLLDLEIRHASANHHSLDDVMRAMYKKFPLIGSGYTLDDFQKTAEDQAGGSLKEFFDAFVYGTKPLPWDRNLGYAGLQTVSKDTVVKGWIGIGTNDVGEKTRINRVAAGSPAYLAGLDIGDEIVALNGFRVRTSDLNDRIAELHAGATVKLTVFRNDQLREFNIKADSNPIPSYKIVKVSNPTEMQKAIYQSWLRATW